MTDQVMENRLKPEIPAKTFLKSVDKSSEDRTHSVRLVVSSEDNDSKDTVSDETEVQCLTNSYEKSVSDINEQTVDEVFAKTFGKNVRISDEISEITTTEDLDPLETTPTDDIIYPDDKNPFGDEEEDIEEDNKTIDTSIVKPNEYPDDKNPFGDEESDETAEEVHKTRVETKPEVRPKPRRSSSDALNPFGDDEDDEQITAEDNSNTTPKPKPRQSLNVSTPSSGQPSPTSSLRARKKRTAPTPPTPLNLGIPQVNSSCSLSSSVAAVSGESSRRDSTASNISSEFSSVPNSRTPTPLPRLKRRQKSTEELTTISADNQQISDNFEQNSSLRSNDSDSELKRNSASDLRLKKRPAPPIPAVKRMVKGSLAEIEAELNSIGDQLPEVERKGKEFEEILTKRLEESATADGQAVGAENNSLMNDFLTTARERCRLGRRQKELMYM